MEKLLRFIADNIVGEKTKVIQEQKDGEIIFTILVPQEKIGWIIGKGGKVIKAIRALATIAAINEKVSSRWQLEVSSLS